MSGCRVSRSESKDKKKFFIEVKTAGKIALFSSADSVDQQYWIDAIKKTKEKPRSILFSTMPGEFSEVGKSKKVLFVVQVLIL